MLTIENVTKSFGGLSAVCGVSLQLGKTPITGLVGPNGSGKTTLFHMITGFYSVDKGRVFLEHREITNLKPHLISRMGLLRTFQHTRVLPFLSTLENLIAAAPLQRGESLVQLFLRPGAVRKDEKKNAQKAWEVLDTIKLQPLAEELAGRLSYGQQRLLELGRILMADPRVILLDEPTAGINPSLVRDLVQVIRGLTGVGIQVFLIEHNMPLVMELCDRVLVMDAGGLIFEGSPHEAVKDKAVIEAYLGKARDASKS